MEEPDRPEVAIYNAAQKIFRMTKTQSAETPTYISYLLLRNRLIPSDLVKCLTATQKLRNCVTTYLSLQSV